MVKCGSQVGSGIEGKRARFAPKISVLAPAPERTMPHECEMLGEPCASPASAFTPYQQEGGLDAWFLFAVGRPTRILLE